MRIAGRDSLKAAAATVADAAMGGGIVRDCVLTTITDGFASIRRLSASIRGLRSVIVLYLRTIGLSTILPDLRGLSRRCVMWGRSKGWLCCMPALFGLCSGGQGQMRSLPRGRRDQDRDELPARRLCGLQGVQRGARYNNETLKVNKKAPFWCESLYLQQMGV